MTNRKPSPSTCYLAGHPVPIARGVGFVAPFAISSKVLAVGSTIITIAKWLAASHYRLKVRGAKGANKTVVTDYRFVGPACGTQKPVGWAGPQTPQAHKVASA